MPLQRRLTSAEQILHDRLPKPPAQATVRPNGIFIVEWLPEVDRRTGAELHEWMEGRRVGSSVLAVCATKAEILDAIREAAVDCSEKGIAPILHLEAHGCHDGLSGPDGLGGTELLSWSELTDPLQELNLATRCNLMIVVAACTGFAAIQALVRGPRAPAVALVGPDDTVMPRDLLAGMKEFYRRWSDENPRLEDMVVSASREVGTVTFEVEPFATLAHEAIIEELIVSLRPERQRARQDRLRDRLLAATGLSSAEITDRLRKMPKLPPADQLQRIWDEMFMIDVYPENRVRFGVDMMEVARLIAEG